MTEKKNIVQFPGKSNEDLDKLTDLMSQDVPESCENTSAYFMTQVFYTPKPLDAVDDLLQGGKRNRRWGAVVSLGIIPGLDESALGPAILPQPPAQFFDADSLEELRERINFELDKAIEMARISKDSPEVYQQYNQMLAEQMGYATSDGDPDE
jgi:hypothetical protein